MFLLFGVFFNLDYSVFHYYTPFNAASLPFTIAFVIYLSSFVQ